MNKILLVIWILLIFYIGFCFNWTASLLAWLISMVFGGFVLIEKDKEEEKICSKNV